MYSQGTISCTAPFFYLSILHSYPCLRTFLVRQHTLAWDPTVPWFQTDTLQQTFISRSVSKHVNTPLPASFRARLHGFGVRTEVSLWTDIHLDVRSSCCGLRRAVTIIIALSAETWLSLRWFDCDSLLSKSTQPIFQLLEGTTLRLSACRTTVGPDNSPKKGVVATGGTIGIDSSRRCTVSKCPIRV